MSNYKDKENIFNSFGREEQDSAKHLWNAAKESVQKEVVTPEETEAALQHVRQRLGLTVPDEEENQQGATGKPRNSLFFKRGLWLTLLSAAAVLIASLLFVYPFAPTVVEAPAGEQLSYVLPDGTSILLNSGTTIRYNDSFGKESRTLHMQGEAFFNVEHSDIPFFVHTADASVHVTGTSFQVRSWEDDAITSIMVAKGSVRFYPSENPASNVNLTPGQSSSITSENRTPSAPTSFNPQIAFAWQQNQFAYQNTPVRSIFRDLERRFNIEITVEETEILNSTLSTFYSGSVELETLMQDICTVKGLSYSKTANGFRVYFP